MKKKYCLIGERLSHSYSKDIHQSFGLDYTLEEVKKTDLEKFVKTSSYDGFNVTIPYKTDIMPFLDEISVEALSIGSVNTVVRKNGRLSGYNTDFIGMDEAIKKGGGTLSGKKVAILGTGGAAKTAFALSRERGAKTVFCVSRNGDINYDNIYTYSDIDVIINTTPLGMYPHTDECPLDLSKFQNISFVFDAVYNPLKTVLVQNTLSLNIKAEGGLYMLVSQAVKAEEIWGENSYTISCVDKAYSYILKEKCNIVLEGMPGSGKTTIGRYLASSLSKQFVDTDEEIEKKIGLSSFEIIQKYGESKFREIESEVIKELSLKNSLVIALGGGAPLKEENRTNLKKNGIVVYIKRPLKDLLLEGRPLSLQNGVEKLYKERSPIYENFKDIEIDNIATIESVTDVIINRLFSNQK